MTTYAIIPARSGSKGLPHKNIRPLGGHPLLAWSIVAARAAAWVDRVFVSTDSEEYAAIARQYGAETPFLRPEKFSGDMSPDSEFLIHALEWWSGHGVDTPDLLLFLRPTTPLRNPETIALAVQKMIAAPHATSLCTGFEIPESPVKNFIIGDDGYFHGLMGDEFLSFPRQQCPRAYVWDGYSDILRPEWVKSHPNDIYGPKRLPFITEIGTEIDTGDEFEYIEYLVEKKGHVLLSLLNKAQCNGDQ